MKKLSSFLVLMLIALMLFVSCNGSTPTKEESNSSSNGSAPTITERAATDADYELFFNIDFAEEVLSGLISKGKIPSTSYKVIGESSYEFYGCTFNSYATNGSTLPVTLYGSMHTEGSPVKHYKINLTEGTKIGGIKYTVDAEFTNGKSGFNFTRAMVNGIKVNGLSELLNDSFIRTATKEDAVLIKKILKAFDYVKENYSSLEDSDTLIVDEDGTNFKFNNFVYTNSESKYILYGILNMREYDNNKSYSCFLNPGTKIDGTNHYIFFNVNISIDESGKETYTDYDDFVMIDSHQIMGLQEALNAASTN